MYSESEIHKALEKYGETGSIAATIVDALKSKYSLPPLLDRFDFPKSNH